MVAIAALLPAACDRPDSDAARWLDLEIVRPEVAVVEPPKEPVPDADGLITKVITVPPTFFFAPSSVPGDPFAEPEATPGKIMSARKIFEKAGIQFGPGSSVTADTIKGLIVVRQTPDQMELVEAYTWSGGHLEQELAIRLEIHELPAPFAADLIRSAAPHTDHSPEHRAVTDLLRDGKARLVICHTLPCRSGQRALVVDGVEVSRPSPILNPEPKESGSDEAEGKDSKPTRGDAWMEIDPILGADGITIDYRLTLVYPPDTPLRRGAKFDPRNPGERPQPSGLVRNSMEHHGHVKSGEYRIIASWRSTDEDEASDPGLVHVAFLQIHVVEEHSPFLP